MGVITAGGCVTALRCLCEDVAQGDAVTSLIAWLDTSSEEQRRIRDLIRIFEQSESRDELGIGQIRDAFSDILFPGTSVIQTRARYYLFVPWIFQDGARRGRAGAALKAWTDIRERRLIETLRAAGEVEGLIGRRAGPAVKILPSTIYWSGLVRYEILAEDVAADRLGLGRGAADETEELAYRMAEEWNPTLPAPPDGFPDSVPDGFALRYEEASWLSERIQAAAPGTLLAHLLKRSAPPDQASDAPWRDSACADAPTETTERLCHAQLFSLGMHGAALLYNLLIAKKYEQEQLTRIENPIEDYHSRLADWADECRIAHGQLSKWDRPAMWDLVRTTNPRVSAPTQLFVNAWLDAVVDGRADNAAEADELQGLVAEREQQQKKKQSRLTNERLLRTWSGESGSARLTYRWGQVRGIVRDIHDGMATDAGT